jgi:anti-sigma factor RsiW
MTCRRAFDVDLAGFLRDPRAPELADFIEHYPRCADCSAEVRAWTEVHLGLVDRHPDAAELLAYQDGTLSGDTRDVVDRHLQTCPSCAEELRAVRRFDEAGGATGRPEPPPRSTTGWLRRVLWHPAVGYGVALVALAAVGLQHRAGTGPPPTIRVHEATQGTEPAPSFLSRGTPRPTAPEPAEERQAGGASPALRSAAAPPPKLDLHAQSIAIPVTGPFGPTGLEVRIRDETGTRELLQRFAAPTRDGAVVAQLPAGWLTLGGRWDVEVRTPGSETQPARHFTVDVPRRLRD